MTAFNKRSAPITIPYGIRGLFSATTTIIPWEVGGDKDTRSVAPFPLTDTQMQFTRTMRNSTYYVEGSKFGDAIWMWGGATTFIDSNAPSASDLGASLNKALSRFSSGDFNAAVALGEGRETAKMVVSALSTIGHAAMDIKAGRFLEAANTLSTDLSRRQYANLKGLDATQRLSNGWLSYQYGWKPLVNDVYGAVDAYHKKLKVGDELHAVDGPKGDFRGSQKGGIQGIWDSMSGGKPVNGTWKLPTVPPRTSMHGQISNPNLRSLNELGLLNPAAIAWELMPFSFVIDWFVPIGDLLGGLTASAGVSNLRISQVSSRTRVELTKGGTVPTVIAQDVTRSILVAGAVPSVLGILKNVLNMEASLNSQQVASALALARQRFR